MFSELDPSVVYTDISPDILEHDDDVVSDLWDMNGRNVYRGSRDPHYKHANVYWLYDENMERVGLTEHSLKDHGDFRVLWFRDTPFGTLFHENWITGDNIWSHIPRHVFEKFLSEGWTTPRTLLERSLRGELRPFTVDMLLNRPTVYSCKKCGKHSLQKFECGTPKPLDIPDVKKVWFIDEDMIMYFPPPNTKVFTWLSRSYGDDLRQEQVQEPVQEMVMEQTVLPSHQEFLEHRDPQPHSEFLPQIDQPHHELPRQETLVQPLSVEEDTHEHNLHAKLHQSLDLKRRRSV